MSTGRERERGRGRERQRMMDDEDGEERERALKSSKEVRQGQRNGTNEAEDVRKGCR